MPALSKFFLSTKLSNSCQQVMMPKIVSKLHNPHMLETTLAQHRTRRPQESTVVVLAKDPPKVKLEIFSQPQSARVGVDYAYLCLGVFLGFLQQCRTNFSLSWGRGIFPYKEDPYQGTHFTGYFPYKEFIDGLIVGCKIFPSEVS